MHGKPPTSPVFDAAKSRRVQVEGSPRPAVYWRRRDANSKVVYAACPQGDRGNYREVTQASQPGVVVS